MHSYRDVSILAAALALAFAPASVAAATEPVAGGGDSSVPQSVPLTPHSIGLPGGTLNPTGGGDPRVSRSVPITPHSIGLPGGTLNPTGGGDPRVSRSVPLTPHQLGLPGGTLDPLGTQPTALVQHRSNDSNDWVIGIGAAAGLAVIGTGLASKRRRRRKDESSRTVQPA
jgi:hypothetical protein